MQFAEGLSDRQAADAVRGRLDWKYLLGLELTAAGFDHSVLAEFRDRLIPGDAGSWSGRCGRCGSSSISSTTGRSPAARTSDRPDPRSPRRAAPPARAAPG
nr:transposase [Streptomyces sparsogenes]